MTDMMNFALDMFGAFTDPAGFIGGQPRSQMLSAGMKSAFNAARQIGNSMSGGDHDGADASAPDPAPQSGTLLARSPTRVLPVRWSGQPSMLLRGESRLTRWQGGSDFRVLSKPKTIEFSDAPSPGLSEKQNRVGHELLESTFRMAMALEAAATAQKRLTAAVSARDQEWQDKQGRALLYSKRAAGIEMVQVAMALRALQDETREAPAVTEANVREGQQKLRVDGFPAAVVDVSRQLGLSDAEREASRQRLLAQEPQQTAFAVRRTVQGLQDALYRYGAYLALLPETPAPWN
jgi:hypothetical protein